MDKAYLKRSREVTKAKRILLHFRLNDILLPWMHLTFFGAAHSQEEKTKKMIFDMPHESGVLHL